MSWFWIIGIAVNVALTVLAIAWLLREMRRSRRGGGRSGEENE